LCVVLTSDLKWTTHVNHICSKVSKWLFALRLLRRNGVRPQDLRRAYCRFVRPVPEHACPVWHSSLPKVLSDQIEHIQKRALKIILPNMSYRDSLSDLKLPTLDKNNYRDASSKIFELLPKPLNHEINLRNVRNISLFKSHTKRFGVIAVCHIA
jgi:hypothetical protein